MASFANVLDGSRPALIFSSSSTGASTGGTTGQTAAGNGWVPVHEQVRNISFQAVCSGSSVGVLVSAVMNIEVSNDGVNPLATVAGTITLSSAASPGCDGFSMDSHWNYVRGNLQSISTGLVSVIASAHYAR